MMIPAARKGTCGGCPGLPAFDAVTLPPANLKTFADWEPASSERLLQALPGRLRGGPGEGVFDLLGGLWLLGEARRILPASED
mmetsp:Transcript_94705/g.168248  ORF Transcript_94705/g.168248 Transcript_94705/m.168248 type:complete len:83 (+) Transcript_94705:13-261(+)